MTNIWNLVMIVAIVVIIMVFITAALYYFMTRKSIKARQKHFQELHEQLKAGDKVEFGNGLRGTIVEAGLETCDVKVKSGAIITVSRYTISDIIK